MEEKSFGICFSMLSSLVFLSEQCTHTRMHTELSIPLLNRLAVSRIGTSGGWQPAINQVLSFKQIRERCSCHGIWDKINTFSGWWLVSAACLFTENISLRHSHKRNKHLRDSAVWGLPVVWMTCRVYGRPRTYDNL
jgi:hypothetical protein